MMDILIAIALYIYNNIANNKRLRKLLLLIATKYYIIVEI